MNHAHTLILAIQSCEPDRLRQVIAQLDALADQEVSHLVKPEERALARRSKINDRVPDLLGLTALHVAAKAYSAHLTDPMLARVFNEMVQDLLDAGASPYAEVGATYKRRWIGGEEIMGVEVPGQTVAEVCEGRLPPALMNWFAALRRDDAPLSGHDKKTSHSTSQAAKKAQRKLERERARMLSPMGPDEVCAALADIDRLLPDDFEVREEKDAVSDGMRMPEEDLDRLQRWVRMDSQKWGHYR